MIGFWRNGHRDLDGFVRHNTLKGHNVMANEANELETRLKALDASISDFRKKLELHGRFSAHHDATEKELRERWDEIQKQLADDNHKPEHVNDQIGWLERAIERWVVSSDLDYKG